MNRLYHESLQYVSQTSAAARVPIGHMTVDSCCNGGAIHGADVHITDGRILHLSLLNDERVRGSRLVWQVADVFDAIEDAKSRRVRVVFLDYDQVFVPKAWQVRIVLVVYPRFNI